MSLSKNTLWNVVGNVAPLLLGALTIPYLIRYLGMERFGILTLMWAIVGYFSLFDFGLGRGVTQQVANALGNGRSNEASQIIKVGVSFTVLAGCIGGLILLLGAYPLSHFGMGVTVDLQQEVFYSLVVVAIGIPFATLSNGLRGALEGYESFIASNLGRILLGVSIFLFPLISIWVFGQSLIFIACCLVLARLLSCLLFFLLVARLPNEKFWLAKPTTSIKKRLIHFSAWMALTNLISPILINADRFFIAYFLGAVTVALYTVPFEFLVRLLILPGALGATLLPNLARSHIKSSKDAKALYMRSLKITSIAMIIICLFAALMAYPLMDIFISKDFAMQSWPIAALLSLGVCINGVAYIPYTSLHAAGSAKVTGLLHLIEFVAYIPLLIAFIHFFGLIGAALAWLVRVSFDAISLFWLHSRMRDKYVLS
jgi:O-antigen/teichoic acid export membrane protein